MAEDQWNPVQELKAQYPGLQSWSDSAVLEKMLDTSKFKSAFPQYAGLSDDRIKQNISKLLAKQPDYLTTNRPGKNGKYQGVYAMQGPNAQIVHVPYDKVPVALATGEWGWTNIGGRDPNEQVSSGEQYFKDKEAEGKSPTVSGIANEVIQRTLRPSGNLVGSLPIGAGLDVNAAKAAGRVLYNTPEFLKNLAVAAYQTEQGDNHTLLDMLDPTNIPKGIYDQFRQDLKTDPTGKLASDNALGTLLGLYVVGKASGAAEEIAPKIVARGAEVVKGAPRATMEAVTETSPRDVKTMAEDLQKKNEDARKKAADDFVEAQKEFEKKKAEAEHATTGKEIEHKYDVHGEAAKQAADYRQKVEETSQYNARVWKKATESHRQEAEATRESNDKVIAKYNEEKQRFEEENKAAEHLLDMRRKEEQALDTETQQYYALEDAERIKAKDAENAAWKPWHDKMDDVPVDGGPIEKKLEPILEVSPEARRILRQLTPDPGDAEPESLFAQDRKAVMATQGFTGEYWDLPPNLRAQVDQITSSNGFTPDPIDLNPTAGVAIPLKVIQRAQSIIGRDIANGRYEGPLLGEMKQVQAVLREVVTTESANQGTANLLNAARAATRTYQEAFGRERPSPKTLDKIREKGANPEEYKEQEEERRLAGAEKISPELAEAYKKVKARREALKEMQIEDELRKALQQVPLPPTVGDVRPGYSLKPMPVFEPPTVGDLRSGYALKPPVEVPEAGAALHAVKQPDRVPLPEEPKLEEPETKKNSPEDVTANKREHIKTQSRELRRMGLRRALYATLTGIPFAIHAAFIHSAAEGEAATLGGIVAGGAVLAFSHVIANLVERPDVANWLSKVTGKDVQMWQKLPEEQKALFTDDMRALVKEADNKHLPVSPVLRAFITSGVAGSQQKDTVQDLKKKAAELKPPDVPGPQSSAKPAWTHVYDEKTGTIVAA